MAIKTLIFDFDGTIVDSNELKNRTYFELFPSVSSKAKEFIGKISRGSKKTRYKIIEEILLALKEIGEVEFSDVKEETEKYAEKFGKVVEDGIINGNGVPGAFEELWFLHNNKYAFYLLSGTPLKSLQKIVKKLITSGKIPPFKKIYGRIDDTDEKLFKKQAIAEIMKIENILLKEIAVIGDGISEYDAALEMRCIFIGITNESNNWEINNNTFPVIADLRRLRFLLK